MSAMRKHYPALTGSERFRMAVAALARKDEADLALLRTICPMKSYTATDHEFQGRWEQSARTVRLFALLWLPALVRLREAEIALVRARTALDHFTEGYIMGANAAWEEAGNTEPYLAREDFERRWAETGNGDAAGEWEGAYAGRCCELKTVWAGFERFCAAVGFAPDVLLGWWSGAGEHIERGRAVLDSDLPIDEAGADEMCAGFLHIWGLWENEAG